MWKVCATIKVIGATVLSSLVQAQGITGIYSCSSGVNNDRPVTYIFNTDFMLRSAGRESPTWTLEPSSDNAKPNPFEFLSTLNNGMLLYVGRLKSDSFDLWAEQYGITKEALPRWGYKEIRLMERRWTEPNFDPSDYILLRTLACKLGVETSVLEHPLGKPESITQYTDNCQKAMEAAAEVGIENIEEFFVAKNKDGLKDKVPAGVNPSQLFFETVIVTVDLYSARIYEAKIDSPDRTSEYNCTVLNIDVPKIDPPENAIKAST